MYINQVYFQYLCVNGLLCLATKIDGVFCNTLRNFECPSVRTYVRPSAPHHSCPLRNSATVQDIFTKLGTNINYDKTMCREEKA